METLLLIIYIGVAFACWGNIPTRVPFMMKLIFTLIWPITFVLFWGGIAAGMMKKD